MIDKSQARFDRVLFYSFFFQKILIMDKPPAKKKRLIHPNEESNEENESLTPPLSSDKIDRKVSFAPLKETIPLQENPPLQEADEESKKKQPRLVMKKMVLNNFKSYAGRQVIGPFHKVNIILISYAPCI